MNTKKQKILVDIYNNTKTLSEFKQIAEQKTLLSPSYLIRVYYKIKKEIKNSKKSDNKIVNVAVSDKNDKNEKNDKNDKIEGLDTNLKDDDVIDNPKIKIDSGETENSDDLKDIYKNMYSDEGFSKEETEEKSKDYNANTSSKQNDDNNNNDSVDISASGLLTTIVKGLNNNLFYGGATIVGNRPLLQEEVEIIKAYSKPIADQHLKMLDDAPELNFLIASFAIPAINRIDLFWDKFSNYLKTLDKNKKRKEQTEQTEPEQTEQSEEVKYNDVQQQTIDQWKNSGFKIDPKYTFAQTIDIISYRDNKIIRNIGSDFDN